MIKFDRQLIETCQINAPRYTSYPTADRFGFSYGIDSHIKELHNLQTRAIIKNEDSILNEMISLYIHIPFCNTLCLYCGCNKIITNDRANIAVYLRYLAKEIELYQQVIQYKPKVIQLHFGGGSPSWLSISEINQVMQLVRQYFDLSSAYEVSMEIDPRHVGIEFIQALHKNGFNRISIGVQDFNVKTQKAVNRVQSQAESKLILDTAVKLGFKSTNIDLIYGLPFQSVVSFAETIDTVIAMKPDRIALFNYAHIPSIFMPQTRIKENTLPSSRVKLDILQMSVAKLAAAGYVFIGMDHFALPNDELAIALGNGTLQRNFQGYSTFANTNMLSFGVSAIGMLGDRYFSRSYYQNVKDLASYYQMLDADKLPILRGLKLTQDDLIRGQIIQNIMCQFRLNYSDIEETFAINFKEYFKLELQRLDELQSLGLIEINPNVAHYDRINPASTIPKGLGFKTIKFNGFLVTDKGRFLIRNVAMIFDAYLSKKNLIKDKYSKTI